MPPTKSERKSFISFVLNTVSFPVKTANTKIILLKVSIMARKNLTVLHP